MSRTSALIRDRLGAEVATRLSAVAGGTRLWIPEHVEKPRTGGRHGFKRLADLVGYETAVRLVIHFGGGTLYVPRGERVGPVDRRAVARLTKRNWSAARIARKLQCSERAVQLARAAVSTNRPDKGGKCEEDRRS